MNALYVVVVEMLCRVLLHVLKAVALAHALELATTAVRSWVWLITWGLPAPIREARRSEVESDLHEHQRHDRELGFEPQEIAVRILTRCVGGLHDDLSWRLQQQSAGELLQVCLASPLVQHWLQGPRARGLVWTCGVPLGCLAVGIVATLAVGQPHASTIAPLSVLAAVLAFYGGMGLMLWDTVMWLIPVRVVIAGLNERRMP